MSDSALLIGAPKQVRKVADMLERVGFHVLVAPHAHSSVFLARMLDPTIVMLHLPLYTAEAGRVLRVLRRHVPGCRVLVIAPGLTPRPDVTRITAGCLLMTVVR